MTPEITRIRAALEHESDDLEWACQPHCMAAVLAHIDAQQAEIERLNADVAVWVRRADKTWHEGKFLETIDAQQVEIERLRRGEFICSKCGLRKDSAHPATHDF